MKIPPDSNRLMPYLILPGAYKFAQFMKDVFGATEQAIIPRSEGVIMHGELRIGDSDLCSISGKLRNEGAKSLLVSQAGVSVLARAFVF